jgi:hypothetical protein
MDIRGDALANRGFESRRPDHSGLPIFTLTQNLF